MKPGIKLSSLPTKPILNPELDGLLKGLNGKKEIILGLLTNPNTVIKIIHKDIQAVQITDGNSILDASNDPEAPGLLKLNGETSITSEEITKLIGKILTTIH